MTGYNHTAKLTLVAPQKGAGRIRRLPASAPIPFRNRRSGKVLANRAALFDRLTKVAELAPNAPLSFVVVKVDGLSEVNRDCGWDAGSECLQLVEREVATVVRATDTAGRLTGTTFGIVCQGSGSTAAGAVAARLNYRINRVLPPRPVSVRVSAASGLGINGSTLVAAALEPFEI